eukprot:ctg_5630.g640
MPQLASAIQSRVLQACAAAGTEPELAMRSLVRFPFSPQFDLEMYTARYVVPHLDGAVAVREAACAAAPHLLRCAARQGPAATRSRLRRPTFALLRELLTVAVADCALSVRRAALTGLASDASAFDRYLAQPEALRPLYLCLHDESLA